MVEDSNIDQPAADAFNTQFGLPALTGANFSTVLVDGTDPGQNNDEDETMVDVSYSHAVAPGSGIRIYLGNQNHTSASAILDAIHAAVTEKSSPCSAISISFSFCGGSKSFYKTQNGFFAQAASQGQSVFVATGDDGAAGLKLSSKGSCVTRHFTQHQRTQRVAQRHRDWRHRVHARLLGRQRCRIGSRERLE